MRALLALNKIAIARRGGRARLRSLLKYETLFLCLPSGWFIYTPPFACLQCILFLVNKCGWLSNLDLSWEKRYASHF